MTEEKGLPVCQVCALAVRPECAARGASEHDYRDWMAAYYVWESRHQNLSEKDILMGQGEAGTYPKPKILAFGHACCLGQGGYIWSFVIQTKGIGKLLAWARETAQAQNLSNGEFEELLRKVMPPFVPTRGMPECDGRR